MQDIFISVMEVEWLGRSPCPGLACVQNDMKPWAILTGAKHSFSAGCSFEQVSVCPPGQRKSHAHGAKECLPSYGACLTQNSSCVAVQMDDQDFGQVSTCPLGQ